MKFTPLGCILLLACLCFTLSHGATGGTMNGANRGRSKEKVAAFAQWSKRMGIVHAPLNWNMEQDLVVASTEIPPETNLCTVPKSAMLGPSSLRGTPFEKCLSSSAIQPSKCVLLFLIHEKYNPRSLWREYIDVLPTDYSFIPYMWSDEELEELQMKTSFFGDVSKWRSTVAQEYQTAMTYIKENPEIWGSPEGYSFDDWRWATLVYKTRSFSSHADGDYLIPFADMFNHGGGLEKQRKVRYIWEHNPANASFTLHLNYTVAKGEHPFSTYGAHTSAALFMNYGFVPNEHQEHDYINTSVPFIHPNDRYAAQKLEVMRKWPLIIHPNKVVEHVLLVPRGIHVSVLANMRLGAMSEEEFEGALKQPELFEKIRNINQPLSLENEFRALQKFSMLLKSALPPFPTTIEQDTKLLEQEGQNMSYKLKNCVMFRLMIKKLLRDNHDAVGNIWANVLNFDLPYKPRQPPQQPASVSDENSVEL